MTPSNDTSTTGAAPIRDQRTAPRGVLPRQLQTWLMVGLALAILGIILVTGHTTPVPRTGPTSGPPTPLALAPDRIQAYQRQLADDEARLRRELAAAPAPEPPHASTSGSPSREPAAADPVADEQRRREYQSLFADNVAFTRRSGDAKTLTPPDAVPHAALATNVLPPPPPMATVPPTGAATVPTDVKERLSEGTVIETVLINRLDGTFAGPVTCLVTTPVYAQDRQRIVIPAGARVLGSAAPIQSWGESRLAVSFHRLLLPDGRAYTLDQFKGLDQIGDTGLKDQVNRHYLQVFGASVAIGALSGLAQVGTTAGFAPSSFENEYRQAAGANLAASAGRVLDRYLNVLPTITIREGHRIKVYLTGDLEIPLTASRAAGGVQ